MAPSAADMARTVVLRCAVLRRLYGGERGPSDLQELVLRWTHFLFGITWIGLLYYLNLVNVRMMPSLEAGTRPVIIQQNLRRVMAWFRHAAWLTVLVGLLLAYHKYWSGGHFVDSPSAITILTGGLL